MSIYFYVEAQPITTPGIYHNAELGLISLSSDGSNWLTIADKNLGATTVYNDGATLSEANCGKYYQWGNIYGFPRTGTVSSTTTRVDASSYGPGNYYSGSTFITRSNSPYDWSTVQNDNLRGGTTGTAEAMQGPCETGYHIPSDTEWQSLFDLGVTLGAWSSGNGNLLKKHIKLPYAGRRDYPTGNVSTQDSTGYYRSSIGYGQNNSKYMMLYSSRISPQNTEYRAFGFSIRPFKNEGVQPREGWTKLY